MYANIKVYNIISLDSFFLYISVCIGTNEHIYK